MENHIQFTCLSKDIHFATKRFNTKVHSVDLTADGSFLAILMEDQTVALQHILGQDTVVLDGVWTSMVASGGQWLVAHNDAELIVVSMLFETSFGFQVPIRVDHVTFSPQVRDILIHSPEQVQGLHLNGDIADVRQRCRLVSPDQRVIANEFESFEN
jgi:hypothetical protein